jgi:hypothetical protein
MKRRRLSGGTVTAAVYALVCIATVMILTPTFIVHESHFYLAAAIRRSQWLNVRVGEILHSTMRWVDEFGTDTSENGTLRIDVGHFQRLAAERDYAALAQLSVDGLVTLYPDSRHNAYYHGIPDSWAFWTVMLMECGVRNCERQLPYDLHSFSWRNTNAWRGLSGSDDVLWAALVLVDHSDLIDSGYAWTGARGARQLFAEAKIHFMHRSGNRTELYWDTNREYTATIGLTLWIAAAAELFARTRDRVYLEDALSAVGTLLHSQNASDGVTAVTALITSDGHVYDGRGLGGWVNQMEWSYNAGVALAALTALYAATNEEPYLLLAERVAQHAVQTFIGARGHVAERTSFLNRDQFSFKGLLLHFLGEFLDVLLRRRERVPRWVAVLKSVLERECEWLVDNRLDERGFCVYWGEDSADATCSRVDRTTYAPQGMATASQLFALTAQLQRIGNGINKPVENVDNFVENQ